MDIIHQGECGQNAKWSLTSENTLIISGEGRMKDYEIRSSLGIGGEGPFMNVINDDYLVPWRDYSNDITQIVIEEGITYIGSLAFCNFQSLESVILPHSLSEIGICSFAVCPNLQEINLNSDISIAEWAFRGSPLLDNTNPEPLDDATKRDLDDLDEIKNEYDFWGEPTEESDNLFQTNRPHINITNTGIYYDYAIKSENDCGIYRYDRLFPQSQIHKTWKDCFFCPEAENYFQKIYLDSYKKRELFANKRKQESIEVDNYYLALIIRKAIAKYQFNQNVAKLRDEVTDKDIEAYIKTINEELNQVKFGLKESESFKKTMFWLWLFLENNLDCENTLSGLGFDNVKQIHTWLNSTKGISYSDSFYNLKEPYLACMEKLLERNDPQVIKTWYVISNLMPPGYDEFMRLDKMYIQELHTKHLWLINNLEFDVKFKMMLPPCYIRNCGNTDIFGKYVIKNLRKDIMKEFPLNSLYVEDELLRGADRHIWDFLINDKNDLGPYIKKEIYNDNKKNEILKYIGLSGGEDEEGVNSNAEYNSDVTAIESTTPKRDDAVNKSDSADDMPKTDGTNTEVSEIEIDYSSVLMKWRELYNKRYKSKGIKTFIPIRKLTEEEVNNLAVGLINSGFIDKTTDSKRLAHILSGKEYDGRDPVIWIKTLKNNHKPSKASILNFLKLLGVKKEAIKPERLNCCFLCSDPNSYVEFAYKNMSNSMDSEYKGDLESIIRSVFKEGDVIIRLMENNKSNK